MQREILRWNLIFFVLALNLIGLSISSTQEADSLQDPILLEAEEYRFGLNGKEIDLEKAVSLLEESATRGNDVALYELGNVYEESTPLKNLSRAMFYYNASAELGNPEAQYALGFMWGTGQGVPKNEPLSLLYYYFSSRGGYPLADLTLGYKYLYGHGVPKSCEKAAARYESAALKVVENVKTIGVTFQSEHERLSDSFEGSRSRHRDEEDIIQYYQYSADTGDPHAQLTMGSLYLQGAFGVPQDYNVAFQYFERAANQGDPGGMANLGFMYSQGWGTQQNNDTAIKMYREAAEKGHPLAQTNLGYMYMHGYGVEKNVSEAIRYFRLSADQGNSEGQLNLGILYFSGDGVRKDYSKALQYFSLASQQGHLVAIFHLAQMQLLGLATAPSCALAVQLFKRVAERGKWADQIDIAHQFFLEGDHQLSLLLYERAAEEGFEIAQSNAGWMYEHALGTANISSNDRFSRALQYYSRSAEQKNSASYLKIGDYYYYGLGTAVDMEKAAFYYQAASNMGSAQAMFNLGYMHQHGEGLPRDLHLAKRHYDMAMASDPEASWLACYLALASLGYGFLLEFYMADQFPIFNVQLDTVLIFILTIILIICIIIKQIRAHQM